MLQPSRNGTEEAVRPIFGLQRLWENGGFALTIQPPSLLTPRPGVLFERIVAQTRGYDAVLAAEAPGGAVALSSMALAVLFQRAGMPSIAQLSGRNKNRLALQGDILGLGALKIPYLLIDTRPCESTIPGQNADARLVADLDGPALLATAARLRDEARFTSGAIIKTPPTFHLGALIDLADPLPGEQLEAAQFLVTAPVSDLQRLSDQLSSFLHARADFVRTRPLLVSVLLDVCVSDEHGERKIDWEVFTTTLKLLQRLSGVRGCNLVATNIADLALLAMMDDSGQLHPERQE